MRSAADWAQHLDRGPFAWRGTLEQFVQAVQDDALDAAAKVAESAQDDFDRGKTHDVDGDIIAERIRALAAKPAREETP